MKNTIKVLGIIAIVAVIGFSMSACGDVDDTSTEGRLTITGLSSYIGWNIFVAYNSGDLYVTSTNNFDSGNGSVTVNGDSVTYYIWKSEDVLHKSYTGNDKNKPFWVTLEKDSNSASGTVTVNFTNGKGSVAFVAD